MKICGNDPCLIHCAIILLFALRIYPLSIEEQKIESAKPSKNGCGLHLMTMESLCESR